jgi:hypothetical protein
LQAFYDLCSVEFIALIFRLGVVIAIFSFIWGLIKMGLAIARAGLPLTYPITIVMKVIQYLLLAEVTILFCESDQGGDYGHTLTAGLILLMYFIGKVQNMQFKFAIIQIQGARFKSQTPPNMKVEFGVIALAMCFFAYLIYHPEIAANNLSVWFHDSIKSIEITPIFGFIFQIVGFFFSLTILMRMVNAISRILSGKSFGHSADNQSNNDQSFDDFEEIN